MIISLNVERKHFDESERVDYYRVLESCENLQKQLRRKSKGVYEEWVSQVTEQSC